MFTRKVSDAIVQTQGPQPFEVTEEQVREIAHRLNIRTVLPWMWLRQSGWDMWQPRIEVGDVTLWLPLTVKWESSLEGNVLVFRPVLLPKASEGAWLNYEALILEGIAEPKYVPLPEPLVELPWPSWVTCEIYDQAAVPDTLIGFKSEIQELVEELKARFQQERPFPDGSIYMPIPRWCQITGDYASVYLYSSAFPAEQAQAAFSAFVRDIEAILEALP